MYWLVAPLLLKKQQLGWRRAAVAAAAIERKFGAPPGGGHLEFIIFQNNSFFARRRHRRVCTGRLWFRDQKDLCVTRGALEISQTSNWDLNVVGDFSNSSLHRYLAGPVEHMGMVGIFFQPAFGENYFPQVRFSLKTSFKRNYFCSFVKTMIALKLLGQPNSYSFHRAYLVVLVYLLYYVDLIIFTGCLPRTGNRVHAIQDLCRQGQFSRTVCSTYVWREYLLSRITFFLFPIKFQLQKWQIPIVFQCPIKLRAHERVKVIKSQRVDV